MLRYGLHLSQTITTIGPLAHMADMLSRLFNVFEAHTHILCLIPKHKITIAFVRLRHKAYFRFRNAW